MTARWSSRRPAPIGLFALWPENEVTFLALPLIPSVLAVFTQWVQEPSPSPEMLTRLTPVEADLYAALATDALGPAVRQEQERVDVTAAESALRTLG